MLIKRQNNLLIGLPDGGHMRKATYEILRKSGLIIPDYGDISSRKYKTNLVLPSGTISEIIIDKPRDLLYSLVLGKVDMIITGSDYVHDFCLFHDNQQKTIFSLGSRLIESAHIDLNHLGYAGTQLGFMVREDNTYDDLDEFILHQDKIICYTEFPMIASQYLSQLASYKSRFGNVLPQIVSNFSANNFSSDVVIIYSHGATESKAAIDKIALIFELRLSGRTARDNKLKLLCNVGETVFNLIYKRKDSVNNDGIQEFVKLIESTIKKNSNLYTVSTKNNE